MNQDEITFM